MSVEVLNDQNFVAHLESKERVVVKYFANWCGSCKLFAPKFRRLSDSEEYTNISFVDVNAEENPEARKLAGVSNLPFFAVFKNGELIEGVATSNEDKVKELLGKL